MLQEWSSFVKNRREEDRLGQQRFKLDVEPDSPVKKIMCTNLCGRGQGDRIPCSAASVWGGHSRLCCTVVSKWL